MDIENMKERDRSGKIRTDDRMAILKRGLAAKKMSRDVKGKLRQIETVILDQPDADKPEGYATETGQRIMAKEARDRARNVKDVGNKSVKDTAKTIKEHIKAKKEQKAGKGGNSQAGSAKRSTRISHGRQSAVPERQAALNSAKSFAPGQRSVPLSQSIQSPQLQMQHYSRKRLIDQKMRPLIRQNRLSGGNSPITARMGKGGKFFQKIADTLKKTFKTGKTTMTAMLAAGWIGVVLIASVSMIGALANTPLGLFFSGGVTRVSMASVIRDINYDFDNEIAALKSMYVYDELNIKGRKSLWKDVLAIYAVKTSMENPQSAQEPQTISMITEENREILKEIFWTMNTISASTEIVTYAVDAENPGPGSDQLDQEPEYKEKTVLTIDIEHLNADQMAAVYEFTDEQKTALAELSKGEYDEMWAMLLYGTTGGNEDILQVALSQLGNEGGAPYWSWWGYSSRVDWCAIFVSWCANECGFLEKDICPKFQGVGTGLNWFRDRGQFREPDMYEPMPGDIIFIDWAEDGFDGLGDHVGIVEKVEAGCVWTVEGNRTDSVSRGVYGLQSDVIIGYGVIVE